MKENRCQLANKRNGPARFPDYYLFMQPLTALQDQMSYP